MTEDRRFRKTERLRWQRCFERVFAERCTAGDSVLVVYVAPNGRARSRLGIRTSRRIGTAVARAYVRRRIREAFRTNKASIPPGYDIVCVPRARAKVKSVDVAAPLIRALRAAVARSQSRPAARTGAKPDREST